MLIGELASYDCPSGHRHVGTIVAFDRDRVHVRHYEPPLEPSCTPEGTVEASPTPEPA